jgi:hypothetical protein
MYCCYQIVVSLTTPFVHFKFVARFTRASFDEACTLLMYYGYSLFLEKIMDTFQTFWHLRLVLHKCAKRSFAFIVVQSFEDFYS